ncbi:hypothetical protein B0H14DRAFT_3480880 [Mycena olivaceomarginata]|nr:hypothetical protein B0H14DRAFT_3480880 [Mycena olivaceomarginata]
MFLFPFGPSGVSFVSPRKAIFPAVQGRRQICTLLAFTSFCPPTVDYNPAKRGAPEAAHHFRTRLNIVFTNAEVQKLIVDARTVGRDLLARGTAEARGHVPTSTVVPVSDDWEDDEELEEEDNQRLWGDVKSPAHIPSLIPAMRILKCPSNAGPVAVPPPIAAGETLEEREAQYQAACSERRPLSSRIATLLLVLDPNAS